MGTVVHSVAAPAVRSETPRRYSQRVSRIKAELRDPFCECEWAYFNELVSSLNEDELRPFGYNYYYINLLSTFLPSRTREEIRALACQCNRLKLRAGWLHTRYSACFARSAATLSKPHLSGWNIECIREALNAGRGLIVCTGHIGCFRHIAFDLMLFGFRVWLAVDTESYLQKADFATICNGHSLTPAYVPHSFKPIAHSVRVIDVESDPFSVRLLSSVLARNEIVVLFMDGNSGYGGPLERSNRTEISFLRRKCFVKCGVASMALLSGTPILPVFARYDQQGLAASIVAEELIISPAIRDKGERRQRAEILTGRLFRFLERHIQTAPEQWEGACTFHRWRDCYCERSLALTSDHTDSDSWDGETETSNIALIKDGSTVLAVNIDNLRIYRAQSRHETQLDPAPSD